MTDFLILIIITFINSIINRFLVVTLFIFFITNLFLIQILLDLLIWEMS